MAFIMSKTVRARATRQNESLTSMSETLLPLFSLFFSTYLLSLSVLGDLFMGLSQQLE